MDELKIQGNQKLNGTVKISRAKNSSLPLMTATLLTEEKVTLNDLPSLKDIDTLVKVLEGLGTKTNREGRDIVFDSSFVSNFEAMYDIVRKMRASILVLGPLVSRFGTAKVSLPGGCAIGTRPIDLHLEGLKDLGAIIKLESGYVHAKAPKGGLVGGKIHLKFPSVGATENLLMACSLAKGESVIKNAAKEPEIVDLCEMLSKMGCEISGAGESEIYIQGKDSLLGCKHRPIADRIETATFLLAALATRSEISIEDCNPNHIQAIIDILNAMGIQIETGDDYIKTKSFTDAKPVALETGPYPDFPTDAQAQMMSFLLTIPGESVITENIFENRFMHVSELKRMGANIHLEGNKAFIQGGIPLSGAPVMCTDLRASAALVMSSLYASGDSNVARIYHLDRGYEALENKLSRLGADVKRIPSS